MCNAQLPFKDIAFVKGMISQHLCYLKKQFRFCVYMLILDNGALYQLYDLHLDRNMI